MTFSFLSCQRYLPTSSTGCVFRTSQFLDRLINDDVVLERAGNHFLVEGVSQESSMVSRSEQQRQKGSAAVEKERVCPSRSSYYSTDDNVLERADR